MFGSLTSSTRFLPHRRGVAAVALTAGALALLVGAAPGSGRTAPSAEAAAIPQTVRATLLPRPTRGPNRPGTLVRSSRLGVRVFVNAKRGFALATLMFGGEATYPAATVDGGRTWRVAGPVFHVPAADAPDVVTLVGAMSPATYFAYAGPGGGGAINVSTDAGGHWWRAYFGAAYAVVATGPRSLIAFTSVPGVYYSHNGGQVWRHASSVTRVP